MISWIYGYKISPTAYKKENTMNNSKKKAKRGVNVEISEENRQKLRVLAAKYDIKLKELGDEAIELLLEKYKSHK